TRRSAEAVKGPAHVCELTLSGPNPDPFGQSDWVIRFPDRPRSLKPPRAVSSVVTDSPSQLRLRLEAARVHQGAGTHPGDARFATQEHPQGPHGRDVQRDEGVRHRGEPAASISADVAQQGDGVEGEL